MTVPPSGQRPQKQAKYASVQSRQQQLQSIQGMEDDASRVEAERVLVERQLAEIQAIEDEAERAEALIDLVPHLPEDLFKQALGIGEGITEARSRARLLSYLASQLSTSTSLQFSTLTSSQVLRAALEVAQQIEDELPRLEALRAIFPQIPASEPQLLQQAFEVAQQIEDESYRSEALCNLFPQIPVYHSQLQQQALEVAQRIEDTYYRVQTLCAIAPQIRASERPTLLQRALEDARKIEFEFDRLVALSTTTPQLPDETRAPVLAEILDGVEQLQSEEDRARILARVSDWLTDPQIQRNVSEPIWRAVQADYEANPLPFPAEPLEAAPPPNFFSQSIANDLAEGKDLLGIQQEAAALADVLAFRQVRPPLAVGILGGWGSGKSFIMHLIRKRVQSLRDRTFTQKQAWGIATNPSTPNQTSADDLQSCSLYVGHLYQIYFNSWTYAKSDLWSSLMQTIFYELNSQLTIEQHLQQVFEIQQLRADVQNNLPALFDLIKPQGTNRAAIWLRFKQAIDLNLTRDNANKNQQLIEAWVADNLGKAALKNLRETTLDWEKTLNWEAQWLRAGYDWMRKGGQLYNFELEPEGKRWSILERMSGAKRDFLLRQEFDCTLGQAQGAVAFDIWQAVVDQARSHGVVWDELSDLRQQDRATLERLERDLAERQKALESLSAIATLTAQKKLEQRKSWFLFTAFFRLLWVDLLHLDLAKPEQAQTVQQQIRWVFKQPRAWIGLFLL